MGCFIGYPEDSMGFFFYLHDDQRIIVALQAHFLEDEFILEGGKGRKIVLEEQNETPSESSVQELRPGPIVAQPPRRSGRIPHEPERYGYLLQGETELHTVVQEGHEDDPCTYDQVMVDVDASRWREAMETKMNSMQSNQVWTLVDRHEGIKPIGCKWIYKRKIGSDGKVDTFKVRLVAKGYSRREGIDYQETFSPVAMIKSI